MWKMLPTGMVQEMHIHQTTNDTFATNMTLVHLSHKQS